MHTRITVTVNSVEHTSEVSPRTTLATFLRRDLCLTGTHIGCESGSCGACTVELDGQTVKSCCVLAAEVDGREVVTIEGLGDPESGLDPLQQSFVEQQGMQCGFCTPGMIMSARALLADHPDPTNEQIQHGLAGNICRCTGYANIYRSIRASVSD